MLRENQTPGSRYVFLGLTCQGGSVLQSRAVADNGSQSIDGPLTKPPGWVKLIRNGNLFSGYVSADGTNWNAAGSVILPLNKNLQAGLALTAHNNAALNSTLFDDVAVSKGRGN